MSHIPGTLEKSRMTNQCLILILIIFILFLKNPCICLSEENKVVSPSDESNGMLLTKSVICEEIKDGQPFNENIIFSSELSKITCYTEFEKITKKITIYHCWYYKNNLSSKKIPLVLNPPHWSTFSQIQPRETDKGPWRVEITDQEGNVIKILRFSIVE